MKTKKIIASFVAVMMTAAMLAGCGGSDGTDSTENRDTVNLAKVDGTLLNSEATAEDTRTEIGDVEFSIGDAKLIEYDGVDIAVVEFTFKNNGDTDANFTGVVRSEAYQDGAMLMPTVVSDVEGIDMMTLSENIGKGHQITVDKAFRLRNREDEIEIQVTEITNGQTTPQSVSKYYSIPE